MQDNSDQIKNYKTLLRVTEDNYCLERDALTALQGAVKSYKGTTFNKHLCNHVNKALIEQFGSDFYDRYERQAEEVGKVYTTIQADYSSRFVIYDRRAFSYSYREVRNTTERYDLYAKDVKDLLDAIEIRLIQIDTGRDKVAENFKDISKIVAKRVKLDAEIRAFNDQLHWSLGDSLRVK